MTTSTAGRERQLAELLDAVRAAAGARGTTIFLAGEAGSGKGALLDALAGEAAAELPGTLVVSGTCRREHEAQSPYEPFAEILLSLVTVDRSERARHAVVEVLKESAPDWLAMIPVVGAGLGAGVKTALRFREAYRDDEREERERLAQDRAEQFLAALAGRLDDVPAALLVVEAAQWIDRPSAVLLERVARFAEGRNLAVVAAYRPAEVDAEHPLHLVEDELLIADRARRVELGGLDEDGVAAYARALCGRGLAPDVAAWLRAYTEGSPLFVGHLLPVLERHGILVVDGDAYAFHADATPDGETLSLAGRLAGVELPDSVVRAVERRLDGLDREDLELLEVASVEGPRFLSSTLARVAEVEERQLLRRLGDFEKEHGVIRAQAVLERRRYAYEFAHLLLQQQIYERLSEPERVEYHYAVAEALRETFGESPPRPVLLDLARHLELGREPEAAARQLLRAAQSAYLDGASPQAAALAARGLALLRVLPERSAQAERDLAELAALRVAVEEPGAATSRAAAEELAAALAEGRAAAERCGDAELRARLAHAAGNLAISTEGVEASRRALEEALSLAREADAAGHPDAVLTQVRIMVDLGNAADASDIGAGLAVLREARGLAEARLDPSEPALARLLHRLDGFIGIGELDRGALGEARRLLDGAVEGMTALGLRHDLPRLLNYRAQARLAAADFDGAAADLVRALEEGPPGPWHAYNRATLAKVHLDRERWEEAGPELRRAWDELAADPQLSLGLLVRAYLVEYLLRPGSSEAELDEASALIETELAEAEAGGFPYCVAWGESLAAELALRRGDPAVAAERSTRAVAILAAGDLPVVRTEEVLLRHARALEAAGSSEAAGFRDRARAVVERKAASLPEGDRPRFLAGAPAARALA